MEALAVRDAALPPWKRRRPAENRGVEFASASQKNQFPAQIGVRVGVSEPGRDRWRRFEAVERRFCGELREFAEHGLNESLNFRSYSWMVNTSFFQ